MASPEIRRLIVNADDFGLSSSVNEAVIRAHREGILTTASLMVNEAGFDEAVKLAKENPKLGVGLHLTLLMGHSALPPEKFPASSTARRIFQQSGRRRLELFFQSAVCANSFAPKSTRNFENSTPPACRSTTSTAICICICIRSFSKS
jgi:hypothetical protein